MPLPPQKPPARPGAASTDAAGRQAAEALAEECQKLEEELEALKAKYEMYFLGVEKREPVKWREDLKRSVLRVKAGFTRNAALRFRLQTLHARYLSYERLWLRAAREKEEGRYRRDLFKARLHAKDAGPAPSGRGRAESEDVDLSDFATPTPAPAAPRVGDAQMRALYDAYVAAKRRCNEDVSKLSYEAVARSVSKQVPELVARYKAKSVEFKVVIKEGKAVLKAIPKA